MSTNFYARTAGLNEELHIGQRAGGTEFLFRGYRDRGLTSSDAWYELLSS